MASEKFKDIQISEFPDCEAEINRYIASLTMDDSKPFAANTLITLAYIFKRLIKIWIDNGLAAELEKRLLTKKQTVFHVLDIGCSNTPTYIPLRILLNQIGAKHQQRIQLKFIATDITDLSLVALLYTVGASELHFIGQTDATKTQELMKKIQAIPNLSTINDFDLLLLRAPNPIDNLLFCFQMLTTTLPTLSKPDGTTLCFISHFTEAEHQAFSSAVLKVMSAFLPTGHGTSGYQLLTALQTPCLNLATATKLPYHPPATIELKSMRTGEYTDSDNTTEYFRPDCFSNMIFTSNNPTKIPWKSLTPNTFRFKQQTATSMPGAGGASAAGGSAATLAHHHTASRNQHPIITRYLRENKSSVFFTNKKHSNNFFQALISGLAQTPANLSIALRKAVFVGNVPAIRFLTQYPELLNPHEKNSKQQSAYDLLQNKNFAADTHAGIKQLLDSIPVTTPAAQLATRASS